MVITLSLQITNHIFTSTTVINHRSYEKYARSTHFVSVFFFVQISFGNKSAAEREVFQLLSLLSSQIFIRRRRCKSKPLGCTAAAESIFNSFVFNLGFISPIPLYLKLGVKPNHQGVTKLVYCLLLMPLHSQLLVAATFYYQYQS